jgi:hypothetical protein
MDPDPDLIFRLDPDPHKTDADPKYCLRQITKCFYYQDNIFLRLCKQYVRAHLELASPAWSPWQMGVTETIEKVQEKALKMTSGLKGESYEERCKEAGLETIKERKKSQDIPRCSKL